MLGFGRHLFANEIFEHRVAGHMRQKLFVGVQRLLFEFERLGQCFLN